MKPIGPVRCWAVHVVALAVAAAGCTGSGGRPGDGPTAATVVTAKSSVAQRATPTSALSGRTASPTAASAVLALLAAEQNLDHATSFAHLSAVGVDSFPTVDDWARHRNDSAPVTGFRQESVKGSDVRVLVEHKAAIDPFVGLQFAREHQTWHARRAVEGWLVDPFPEIEPVVPGDAAASRAASQWATARQRCDDGASRAMQAIEVPLGVSSGASALCGWSGAVVASAPSSASPGPDTAALVAQYGTDVLPYVRVVQVAAGGTTFRVLLVPIGESWQVVALAD